MLYITINRIRYNQESLTAFKELEGKKFSELDGESQYNLEITAIRCIILRKENPKNLIQEVFSRLNQGSNKLSIQEIKHTLAYLD